jgi:ammonium transporter, Amt family
MGGESQIVSGWAWLMPFGFALVAAAGLPRERVTRAGINVLSALALAVVAYLLAGFALQYGGVGLAYARPGYDGLIWEWSALGATWGAGWGMAGMSGWALTGPGSGPEPFKLALANLPWVATATLILITALRGRAPHWLAAVAGLIMGGFIYPLAGNWVWGGGWLANLGSNLNLGHGVVDPAGSGLVHVLGASAALAGVLVFLPLRRLEHTEATMALPGLDLPWTAIAGALCLLLGGYAWTLSNPLLDLKTLDPSLVSLNLIAAAAAGALASLGYTWLVAGSPNFLMATRGLAAGIIAGGANPLFPAWSALLLGLLAGLLTPLVIYAVDRLLRLEDPCALLTVHGMGGTLGMLSAGIFADGSAGAGWNGVGAANFLGVAKQGVTGLLAGKSYQADFPGQLEAQAIGLAALLLFGFFVTWLLLAPAAVGTHLSRRASATASVAEPEGIPCEPEAVTPEG